ncbi:hypothetical protein TNCV_7571 [Trichonephila clavipes]|nr:hypothetical protein TNCV_7571 [Trichonephila clavipes]
MCITVNPCRANFKSKEFRSTAKSIPVFVLLFHPLPRVCPWNTCPFAVRSKFSQLARGNGGLMVVKGGGATKNLFKSSDCMPWPWRTCRRNSKTFAMEPFPSPCMRVCMRRGHFILHHSKFLSIFAKYLQQFNKPHAEWSYKFTVPEKMDIGPEKGIESTQGRLGPPFSEPNNLLRLECTF